jgi:putative integral membrane protein (TIGR02587 family)
VSATAEYTEGLGRAVIGAALFALPLVMTMEMWSFGFTMDRLRLVVLLLATFPMLIGLSYVAGFERAFGLKAHLLDAFAAFAVATAVAALVLWLIAALAPGQPVNEVVGKIAAASFPGAIGALLADKQLGQSERRAEVDCRSYWARLFLMAVGGLFLALNVAPTEEMVLIAHRLSPWQTIALALVSLATLHALLFWVDLPGRESRRGDHGFWSILLRHSCAGYGACALVCVFLLWAFGRTDGVSFPDGVELGVVLAAPAALGAGLAGLVVGEQRDGG